MDEKEVGEAMASDAEDHNHKLDVDSKRFEEMMGATLAAADVGHHGEHEDHIEVEDHHLQLDLNNLEQHDDDQDHHPTDVGVELHLLPLDGLPEHVLEEHDVVKDQHHQHPDQQLSMDDEGGGGALSPAAVSAALDGTTAQQLGLMAPPPSEGDHHATTQQPAAAEDGGEVPANTQKIVKRGRGGRRAGAGRKRKSDTAKAEAEAAAAAAADPTTRGASSTTTTTTIKTSLPPPPRASVLGAGSGLAGPPPPKKKKLSTSSPALADDAMDGGGGGGGYGKAPRQLRFGKTILYVREVETTVDFYERAFGLRRRFVHETKQYAELETGSTALAFASNELARNNLAHIDFRPNDINAHPPGLEIALSSTDVHRDYKRAVEAGARSVSLPKTLPWGQVVAYVRDLNGVLVEIASELKTPLKK